MVYLIYDFGCGNHKREDAIGVDIDKNTQADIIADISAPDFPIEPGCASKIYCSHVLEHIVVPQLYGAITNILRTLKQDGVFEIRVPHPGCDSAMVPDHRHAFSQRYIDDVYRRDERMVIDSVEMKRTEYFYHLAEEFPNLSTDVIENCFRNTVHEIVIIGRKR